LSIRFQLAEHIHTDIISHSTGGFPARTGQEFLEFLRAATASGPSVPSPSPLEEFLRTHPAALAFVQAPKPSPASFAKEAHFGVTAFRFINRDGIAHYGRYRITPSAGVEHLDDVAAKVKDANYLLDEIRERLAREAVQFEIHVQVAEEGDIVDDATAQGRSVESWSPLAGSRSPRVFRIATHSSNILFSTQFLVWTASKPLPTRCSNYAPPFIS
jgi:catalase